MGKWGPAPKRTRTLAYHRTTRLSRLKRLFLGLAVVLPTLPTITAPAEAQAAPSCPGGGLPSTPPGAPYHLCRNLHYIAAGLGPYHGQYVNFSPVPLPGHPYEYCDVVYDLYIPAAASARSPVPAILASHGLGGSKDGPYDVAGAKLLAAHGYEVLMYSQLGQGGTTCPITVGSPEWDGRTASQLIDILAARPEVRRHPRSHNPVLGTYGGSYGGIFQWALISVDPRVDAAAISIAPNDLAYSLAPNDDNPNFVYRHSPPGVPDLWAVLEPGLAIEQEAGNRQTTGWTSGSPPNYAGCPHMVGVFEELACRAEALTIATGYTPDWIVEPYLRHNSAVNEVFGKPGVHIPPTLLVQGEADTLFRIPEVVANYRGFKAHRVPVKMILKGHGHGFACDAPGEVAPGNGCNPAEGGYLTQAHLNWFDHYLKGRRVSTGPEVEYFRDWVRYDQRGSAAPAYASAPSWPVGHTQALYLSGSSAGSPASAALVGSPSDARPGATSFVNPPGGEPTSYSEIANYQNSGQTLPVGNLPSPFVGLGASDPPGEAAYFTTPPLAHDLDCVGIPTVEFDVDRSAPVDSADPATWTVLYGKIYDVAPDGTVDHVHRLVSAVRLAPNARHAHINLQGLVHRFKAGHRIRLVVASTDSAHVNSKLPNRFTARVGPIDATPAGGAGPAAWSGTLTLPVL